MIKPKKNHNLQASVIVLWYRLQQQSHYTLWSLILPDFRYLSLIIPLTGKGRQVTFRDRKKKDACIFGGPVQSQWLSRALFTTNALSITSNELDVSWKDMHRLNSKERLALFSYEMMKNKQTLHRKRFKDVWPPLKKRLLDLSPFHSFLFLLAFSTSWKKSWHGLVIKVFSMLGQRRTIKTFPKSFRNEHNLSFGKLLKLSKHMIRWIWRSGQYPPIPILTTCSFRSLAKNANRFQIFHSLAHIWFPDLYSAVWLHSTSTINNHTG